ncbi:NUDIX domain-containing protein [Paludibacterium yongneupense]|uniref:NUDIX domain-containing protein n=1 Tax=Paludibacterium yongneupense TaxID=400061 RepID=UPI0004217CF2|nr:NUDIX hydrolase [Paludibacterium yongneupense]
MDLVEKTLESDVVYDGVFIKVSKDRVLLPDGKTAWREYIRHPGAVAILALTGDGQLVLERQYRHAPGRVFLEIPAGKIDPHEPTVATARRELLEETGLSAERWTCLGTAYPCIGYADEEITYYLAEGLSQSERQLDEGEFLEVLTMPLDDVYQMALTGEICDSKSLVGLFWLRAHREGKLPGAAV